MRASIDLDAQIVLRYEEINRVDTGVDLLLRIWVLLSQHLQNRIMVRVCEVVRWTPTLLSHQFLSDEALDTFDPTVEFGCLDLQHDDDIEQDLGSEGGLFTRHQLVDLRDHLLPELVTVIHLFVASHQ